MDLYYHWKFREGKIFPLPFYAPVFHTSAVTQCLNSFADGSLLLRIRAYSPDSLIIVIPLGVSKLSFWQFCLSAASTCFFKAPKVSEYPNAVATSFPTNHGSPEISTVLSSPNCGWLNTVGASVGESASGSIRGIYFSDPLTEQNFLPISLTHSHFGNLLFFKYQNGSRDLHN